MIFRRVTGCLLIIAASVLPALGQGRPTTRNNLTIAGNVRDDTDQHVMENVRVDLKLTTGVPDKHHLHAREWRIRVRRPQ